MEDSPDLAEALQRNLTLDGYDVALATRAAQALPLVASTRPDLIILDLGLPDRDGYSVLQDLRERGNPCPVLILSARNLEADKLQGFRLGADDYVTKPFNPDELSARVSAVLRRAGGLVSQPEEVLEYEHVTVTDRCLHNTTALYHLEQAVLLGHGGGVEAQIGLLHHVFRLRVVAQEAARESIEALVVTPDQGAHRGLVAGAGPSDQDLVAQALAPTPAAKNR